MSSLLFSWSDGTAFSPITQGGLSMEGHPEHFKNDVSFLYDSLSLTDSNSHTIEFDILVALFIHERWIWMNHS